MKELLGKEGGRKFFNCPKKRREEKSGGNYKHEREKQKKIFSSRHFNISSLFRFFSFSQSHSRHCLRRGNNLLLLLSTTQEVFLGGSWGLSNAVVASFHSFSPWNGIHPWRKYNNGQFPPTTMFYALDTGWCECLALLNPSPSL